MFPSMNISYMLRLETTNHCITTHDLSVDDNYGFSLFQTRAKFERLKLSRHIRN